MNKKVAILANLIANYALLQQPALNVLMDINLMINKNARFAKKNYSFKIKIIERLFFSKSANIGNFYCSRSYVKYIINYYFIFKEVFSFLLVTYTFNIKESKSVKIRFKSQKLKIKMKQM